MQITVTVNGVSHTRDVEARLLLIHFLRDDLGLTGSHWGCDTSNCGACVVWLDETPVKSCTVLAAMADGHRVRTVEDLARVVAAAMLEAAPEDLEWSAGRWQVRGDPGQGRTIAEIAMAAHSSLELPDGVEGHLDAETVYNPPNLTYPYGAYICVVDVDPGTGSVALRRFIAVDDSR